MFQLSTIFAIAEITRRFRYLEPENRKQIVEKLNDLLAYAEVAKTLRSELIAIIVLSKLHKWENLLLHPEIGGRILYIKISLFMNFIFQKFRQYPHLHRKQEED